MAQPDDPTSGRITNSDLRDIVNDANENLRREFTANLTATGVQIGAVESSLRSKMEALKWRMLAALLGGQVLASVVAAVITNLTPRAAVHQAAQLISSLL